ncbi:BTAD domain-containing putative transcriptional regulator [Nonomuraea pusilla]|uniref:BTAD domain-containing putative transcriptional regulator n=1 Tax=Nonomuraea pusilla TaxID=46177 RepID=UPI003317ABEE
MRTCACPRSGFPPATLVPRLAAEAAVHRLRESLHLRLIRALARSGRPADALRAYEELRRELSGQLGVDPYEELRRLHLELPAGPGGSVMPPAVALHRTTGTDPNPTGLGSTTDGQRAPPPRPRTRPAPAARATGCWTRPTGHQRWRRDQRLPLAVGASARRVRGRRGAGPGRPRRLAGRAVRPAPVGRSGRGRRGPVKERKGPGRRPAGRGSRSGCIAGGP